MWSAAYPGPQSTVHPDSTWDGSESVIGWSRSGPFGHMKLTHSPFFFRLPSMLSIFFFLFFLACVEESIGSFLLHDFDPSLVVSDLDIFFGA